MYIISTITVFDNDHELWETHVGLDLKFPQMPLRYSVWDFTEQGSRQKAEELVFILENKHMVEGL